MVRMFIGLIHGVDVEALMGQACARHCTGLGGLPLRRPRHAGDDLLTLGVELEEGAHGLTDIEGIRGACPSVAVVVFVLDDVLLESHERLSVPMN